MTPARRGAVLAELELLLALAIVRLGGGAYGAGIRRQIEERAGRTVSLGAVYVTLARLADKGLVTHQASDPLPVRGGRSRKVYRLTASGQRALRDSAGALTRMLEGIDLSSSRGATR
jgi:DNA-binding PadR family transcriptional regulator